MRNRPIVPCLWCDDEAEEAASLYTRIFPHGRISAVAHYPESVDNPSGKPRGSVLTVELEIAGQRFTALNGGPHFKIGPSISFFVEVDSASTADRLFAALAERGKVLMPLGSYPWSERYGWIQDRYGVSWQIMTERGSGVAAAIVPCLMFAGPQRGRAEEAMQAYTHIFPDARIERIERYAGQEGPAGKVKHGRFVIAGQAMVAMDSHIDHSGTFSEALSLQLTCDDQQEVDRYWGALSEGGEPGPCGWLTDRFGVSWQIVPAQISQWMSSPDQGARERTFQAVMGMKKLNIAALQAAFEGK